MKLAKQLFFFYGWVGLPDLVGGREVGRDRTMGAKKKKETENVREGKIFSCKAQGCRGLDFPKFLIRPIICHLSFALSITTAQSICHHSLYATVQSSTFITCSCEGCWEGGRDGVRRRERERERQRGRGIGLKKGERELKRKKISQEVASSKERKKGSQPALVFVFIRSSKA